MEVLLDDRDEPHQTEIAQVRLLPNEEAICDADGTRSSSILSFNVFSRRCSKDCSIKCVLACEHGPCAGRRVAWVSLTQLQATYGEGSRRFWGFVGALLRAAAAVKRQAGAASVDSFKETLLRFRTRAAVDAHVRASSPLKLPILPNSISARSSSLLPGPQG